MTTDQAWYLDCLACPDCGADLDGGTPPVVCRGCGYESAGEKQLDLRPRSPRPLTLTLARTNAVQQVLANV